LDRVVEYRLNKHRRTGANLSTIHPAMPFRFEVSVAEVSVDQVVLDREK
jgi:hypothetical protein